ncbi:toluene tolerance protein [Aestuariicella hydrocarbonica]|uniref:Toluene tolerance protein n=1 Tax=Pseudomaricurvus hydrocarbonicus TaxID=1470433 RepID=A0A9E5JVV5_9GAMM|nr:toluene tolerance protein [Aestuariicella hydrocarbonica]NHO66538.1 toluene tolerance protein [Aestuariicella hydrocarbonica]
MKQSSFKHLFKMKTLQNAELEKLIVAGHVLEKDGHGPKVILLAEDRYLKIFYPKRAISMSRLRSRASQFASNAAKLKKRGITTVGILDVFRTCNPRRDCVCYHGIPGETVRSALKKTPRDTALSKQLGGYIAQLHNAGVMFRSLHFGNVIQLPDQRLGLIDIADMRLNVFTLTYHQRQRNFQHVFRYEEDLTLIHLESFIDGYHAVNKSQGHNRARLEEAIRNAAPAITGS